MPCFLSLTSITCSYAFAPYIRFWFPLYQFASSMLDDYMIDLPCCYPMWHAEEWSRPCLRMYLELEDEPFHNLFYTLIDTSGEVRHTHTGKRVCIDAVLT